MRRRSSAGSSPVATSASTPRARNMSTARELSASAINTFGIYFASNLTTETRRTRRLNSSSCLRGERREAKRLPRLGGVALLFPGPVEPRQKRLDIAALDGRAGPDADT